MLTLEVVRQPWEPTSRRHQAPDLSGVDEDVKLIDGETGETIAFQCLLPEDTVAEQRYLARCLRFTAKWMDTGASTKGAQRVSGIKYPSLTFGFTEPKPLRRRYAAAPSRFMTNYPEMADVLESLTNYQWELFTRVEPEIAEATSSLVKSRILDDWLIAKKPWTSGIINNTAALPYHLDKANVIGSWSSMLTLQKNMSGGNLNLPEYGVTLGVPDGSVTMFDGQGTWHGVTPLVKRKPDAYRYTLVWYAKTGFAKCGTYEEEITRGQKAATK